MHAIRTRRWQLSIRLIAAIAIVVAQLAGAASAPTGVAYAAAPEIKVSVASPSYSSPVALTSSSYGASIAASNTGTSGTLCLVPGNCTISNTANVVDTNLTNAATMTMLVGLGGSSAIAVQTSQVISAGSKAGFVLNNGGGLIDLTVFSTLTIRTYKAGVVQESKSGAGILEVSLLGGAGDNLVGFTTTKDFDQIQVELSSLVAVAVNMNVGYAYIQPAAAAFGSQEVGSTSTARTVTIQNTGDASLSVSGISLSGANANQFATGGSCGSTFPLAIAAGGSCTVQLTFSPTSVGAKAASLTIASNDSDESSVTIGLSGTGVDTTAPAAPAITSPANGSATNDATPDFSGTAEPLSTVTVRNGSTTLCTATTSAGGAWVCTAAPPLAQGSYSVSATAADAAGNTSPASASVSFSIDLTQPNTTLTATPDNPTNSSSATIVFTGSDNLTPAGSLVFECQLDSVTWVSCSSPASYTNLSEGSHTFKVRARDAAGNVEDTPASYTWVVDTIAPAKPTLDLTAITTDRTPVLQGTAEANSTVEVEIDIDRNGSADLVYSVTVDASGNWSIDTATAVPTSGAFPAAGLADGAIDLSAKAYDTAGNASPATTATLLVDATAPAAPVITSPAASSATSDTTPTFSGTAEASSTITVTEGLNVLCTTTANGAGAWSCTPTTPLADASHTVAAVASDAAGNTGVASAGRTFTVDTAAPAAPAISSPTAGSATNDTTPTFSGTAEANSTVTLNDGLSVLCSTTADGSGAWTCTPSVALSQGSHTVTATAVDAAGNTSAASAGRAFTVDTSAPAAPVVSSPASGGTTSDTTPTFSGTAEAGSTITVTEGLNVLCTTTASGGAWACTPATPLSETSHTVSVTASDPAGNVSSATSHSFTVDSNAPSTPSVTDPAPAAIINDTTPVISGLADAGSTVTLELDPDNNASTSNSVIYTTVADSNGAWSIDTAIATPASGSFPAGGLAAGTIGLNLFATDQASNTSGSLTQTFTVDTTAPAAPAISSPASGSTTGDNTPTIGGTAEAGSTITVTEGLNVLCTTVASGGINWSCAPTTPLGDGPHTVVATASDVAGNTGVPSAGWTFTVDTTAPSAPAIDIPVAASATKDSTPTFSGAAEAGSTVSVVEGLSVLCTATADNAGAWSCTPPTPLSEGNHTITATAADATGNTSVASAARTFTVDTAAPSAPAITSPAASSLTKDNTPTFSGTAEASSTITVTEGVSVLCTATADNAGVWSCTPSASLSDGPHTVEATAADAAGNTSAASPGRSFTVDATAPSAPAIDSPATGSTTGNSTPAISGTAEVASIVTVKEGSLTICTAVANAGGEWICTPIAPLSSGSHTIAATASDAAGNTSAASIDRTFTIDTSAPSAPVVSSPAAGSATNDTTPTFSGTAEAGSTITVTQGLNVLCTTIANGAGAWSCTPSTPLSEGSHTVTITAADGAGNSSSTDRTFSVDTTAPAAPVVSSPAPGATTSDTTPTFGGSAEPGSTVTVHEGSAIICSATADGAGVWSCTPTTPLSAGPHSITVVVTDPAGNTGPASNPQTVTIDTSTPIAPSVTAPTPGSTTTDTTPTFTGRGEPGSTATIKDGTTVLCVATADSNGDWSCTPTVPMAQGAHTLTVIVADQNGTTVLTVSLPLTIAGTLKLYYLPLIR